MKIWLQYFIIVLTVLSCFENPVYSQGKDDYYGLSFQSYDIPTEKRTALIIGQKKSLHLGDNFKIAFDLSFVPGQNVYFGYVFRLVNSEGQRINFLFDQKSNFFRLTVDGKYGPQFFPKAEATLYQQWKHFEFQFKQDSIICNLDGQRLGALYLHLKNDQYNLVFGGGSDGIFFATDVPPMKLKNVGIEIKGKLRYNWPLRTGANNTTLDELNDEPATVANPVWLIQNHSHWRLLHEKAYKGSATVSFDPDQEQLYIAASDSVFRISVKNGQELTKEAFLSRGRPLFLGNHALFNSVDHRLYDFYTDLHSIAAFDFEKGLWDQAYDSIGYTEFSQANRIFSPAENALYIFGGYGQMRYKNDVQRYIFQTGTWDTLKPKGDYFSPRYLAAAGMSGDSIYILGGYGSLTGDQLLDPGYAYDLMVYNVKDNRFTKKFSLKRPDTALVFGNAMIIDTARDCYYAFGFSNERYDSHLQLIRGSLQTPEYHVVADRIPFSFQDVLSEANLFWCLKSQKLLAVTLLTTKNKSTAISIYSIAFPPNVLSEVDGGSGHDFLSFIAAHTWFIIILIFILIAGVIGFLLVRKGGGKRVRTRTRTGAGHVSSSDSSSVSSSVSSSDSSSGSSGELPGAERPVGVPEFKSVTIQKNVEPPRLAAVPPDDDAAGDDNINNKWQSRDQQGLQDLTSQVDAAAIEGEMSKKASIQLFGTFEILDKEENQLTTLFSPLLKELFLIILLNSIVQKSGISSKKLNEIFWRNKSDKDANNNRSVNIAKLKSILDKVDSLAVVNEHSKWFVRYDRSEVFVDLAEFQELAARGEKVDRPRIHQVIAYLKKGGLLKHTEYDWLDDFKSRISNLVIDTLIDLTQYLKTPQDADTLLQIANCIFSFDPINEQALSLKCKALATIGRHSLAQSTYQHYCKEYEKMYGEPFSGSFNDIVAG